MKESISCRKIESYHVMRTIYQREIFYFEKCVRTSADDYI